MEDFFLGILQIVASLWDADERPEARKFVVGVGAVIAMLALLLWWHYH